MSGRFLILIVLIVGLVHAPVFAAKKMEPAAERRTGLSNKLPEGRSNRQEGPKQVTQTIDSDHVRLVIQRSVREQLGDAPGEVQVHLLDLIEPIRLPAGSLEVNVTAVGQEELLGRKIFSITWKVDGKVEKAFLVKAEVAVMREVVTALHHIRPHDLIGSEDVTVTRLSLTSLGHDLAQDVRAVIGKRALKPIQAGRPIALSAIAEPYAIRKGDRVTIEAQRSGLLIQTTGTAKGAAEIGQIITVTNVDSGKEVRGKVVGPGVVRVEF